MGMKRLFSFALIASVLSSCAVDEGGSVANETNNSTISADLIAKPPTNLKELEIACNNLPGQKPASGFATLGTWYVIDGRKVPHLYVCLEPSGKPATQLRFDYLLQAPPAQGYYGDVTVPCSMEPDAKGCNATKAFLIDARAARICSVDFKNQPDGCAPPPLKQNSMVLIYRWRVSKTEIKNGAQIGVRLGDSLVWEKSKGGGPNL